MKLNKIIILFMILISILMLGAVCASENTYELSTNDSSEELNIDEPNIDAIDIQNANIETKEIEYNDKELKNTNKITPQIDYKEHMWNNGKYNLTMTLPDNYNGNITVTMKNNKFESSLVNGKGIVELPELKTLYSYPTSYSVIDTHLEYTDYNNGFTYDKYFQVYSHEEDPNDPTTITKSTLTNFFIDDEYKTLIFEIPLGTEGIIDLYIDNEFYSTLKPDENVFVYNLPPSLRTGPHKYYAKLHNSSYYQDTTLTGTFNINCIYVEGPTEPSYEYYGDHQVKIKTSENVTGYVTILIDGLEYTKELLYDDYNIISLYDIAEGTHRGTVIYSGDLNHDACNISFNYFNMKPTPLEYFKYSFSTYDAAVGSNITITIETSDGQTGNISTDANGKTYTAQIIGTVAQFNIPIDNYDFYEFYFKYNGDERHGEYNFGTVDTCTVMTHYEIIIENLFINENHTVSTVLPNDANGNLTVRTELENYSTKVINGTAHIIIPASNSIKTIHAEYTGNDYEVTTKNINLLDNKITVPNSMYLDQDGELLIELADYYQNVTIESGKEIIVTANLTDGKYSIPLRNLGLGPHSLKINFGEKTENKFVYIHPTIIKPNSTMIVGEENNLVLILPKDANGTLIIKDNNKTLKQTTAKDGIVSASLSELNPGTYNLFINYVDEKYGTFKDYFSIKVFKPKMNITASDTKNGLNVKFSDNVTGYVKVDYENKSYFNFVVNGETVLPNLHPINNLTLSYCEQDKTRVIKNDIIPIEIIPTIIYKNEVMKGEDIIVFIEASPNLNGDIVIYDNILEEYEYTNCKVINGTGNYTRTNTTCAKNQDFNIWVQNIFVGNVKVIVVPIINATNEKITMISDANPNDYMIINIDGKFFNNASLATGTATISLANAPSGTHEFEVYDTGFPNISKTFKLTIVKKQIYTPQIICKNLNMYYLDGSKFKVSVIGTTGTPLAGETVIITINKKTYKPKTDSSGVVSLKITDLPKTYKITVKYSGVTATKTVKVKQILTLKKVTIKKSAKKLVLSATLKKGKTALKSKKITFKFNGKKYTAKTNKKGIAKVTIKKSVLKKLKLGKKIVYSATYIKDIVKKNAKVKK